MNDSLKRTPLNHWHRGAGANMADFGGYEMPLWYQTGVKTEHLAVLSSAGIFDTSHMACIRVEGKEAFPLLNYCFTRDMASLKQGRCIYGAFLDEQGHCLDDAIVYRLDKDRFLVCVNAGMGPAIAGHLTAQNREARITDLTGQVAKVDVQGRDAARILARLVKDPQSLFTDLPYFSFKGDLDQNRVQLLDNTPVLLSRSGYTGEFGFEIFIQPTSVVSLWETLMAAGVTACGLGARDSLRAGACLPLSHQDIGPFPFIHHPWSFALPYTQDKKGFTKNFLGGQALLDLKHPAYTYAFAGDSLRKVNIGKETQVQDPEGRSIGQVLTCATDMGITWHNQAIVSANTPDLPASVQIKGLACGFVRVETPLPLGTRLTLREGKRAIEVTLVPDIRPDRTARLAIKHFI